MYLFTDTPTALNICRYFLLQRTYRLQRRRTLECTRSWTKHCRSSTACKMPRRTSNKQTKKKKFVLSKIFSTCHPFSVISPLSPFKTNAPLFTYLWFFLFLFPFLKNGFGSIWCSVFGARNCVVDQTLCTNKTDDDDDDFDDVSFMGLVDLSLSSVYVRTDLRMCLCVWVLRGVATQGSRMSSPSSFHVLTCFVFSVLLG